MREGTDQATDGRAGASGRRDGAAEQRAGKPDTASADAPGEREPGGPAAPAAETAGAAEPVEEAADPAASTERVEEVADALEGAEAAEASRPAKVERAAAESAGDPREGGGEEEVRVGPAAAAEPAEPRTAEPRTAEPRTAQPVRGPEPVRAAEPARPEPDPALDPATLVLSKAAPKPIPAAAAAPAPARRPEPAAAPEAEPDREPEGAAEAPAADADEPAAESAPDPRNAGRRRLQSALWPPRLSRGQLVVALLLFSLGLALAIQVRSTNDHHSQLRGARQEDLVRILDELDSRQQRLQQEKAELEQSLAKLENSSNQAKEAQEQTRKKVTELGVLAGTVKATGPGIVLTVDDPQGQVKADMLLDTLQELRAAGAEAIQINDVRVVVSTHFTDVSGGGVQIDGKKVSQPYRFTVVGNPQDLTPALNIPGGVVRTLESNAARATISQQQKVVVDAVVELKTPQYAKPAPK
ncbi:DUF881 domain-containing protein [Kitasatospora sp. NPDC054939]